MLIKCPECELQISDKAISCPHCGYPLKPEKISQKRRPNRRRRLPNGFGQIVEIKNQNLREPFRAMVTIGKNKNGRPICKILKPKGYFATYNEAYEALVEYNKNPYDLSPSMTMDEFFHKWVEHNEFKGKKYNQVTSQWAFLTPLYNMTVNTVRPRHMKEIIMNATRIDKYGKTVVASDHMKVYIKSILNMMYDYGVEYELVLQNYARQFSVPRGAMQANTKHHLSFTDEEMQKLWDNIYKISFVDILLIQCYTGLRPREIGNIKFKNVDLENNYMIGGMKTAAGIDRLIPIHKRIKPLVEKRYEEAIELGSEYVFNCPDGKTSYELTYDRYYSRFLSIKKRLELNPEHSTHDGRKHFITMAKKYNVDEYAIKLIVGHAITDITESIYTDRDKSWLISEINKIE